MATGARKTQRLKTKETLSQRRRSLCFVLMPFSPDFDALYENALRPAVEEIQGLSCLRADEIYGPRPIMTDIWRSIQKAALLIADLTGRNPNVLYELGLAHAQHKPVVLITQDIADVPFDLRAIRCLVYSNTRPGRTVLQEHLRKTVGNLALDVKRQDSRTLREYAILPIPEQTSTGSLEALAELEEPPQMIALLRQRSEQLKGKKKQQKATNAEIEAVLSLLYDQNVDVVLAALEFLRDHIDMANAPSVYPLLNSANHLIQRAAIEVIKAHHDTSGELTLLQRLGSSPHDNIRGAIIDALIAIGGEVTADHCFSILEEEELSSRMWSDAFRILCRPGYYHWGKDVNRVLMFLIQKRIVNELSLRDRLELVEMLSEIEDVDTRLDPETRSSVVTILQSLCDDPHPRVLGSVAALWIRFGNKQYGAIVDREMGWRLLKDRNRDVLEVFINSITDEGMLLPADGANLLDTVRGDPLLEEDIVYTLHDLKTPGVEDFMLRWVDVREDSAIWALAYFAELPSRKAIQACEAVLASDRGEVSEKVLSAICLARLGDEARLDFIIQNVAKAHPWVGKIARPLLEPIASKQSRRGKAARAILKKISDS